MFLEEISLQNPGSCLFRKLAFFWWMRNLIPSLILLWLLRSFQSLQVN